MKKYVRELVVSARDVSFKLSRVSSSVKDKILLKMAESLIANKEYILSENKKDMEAAKRKGKEKSFLDRLLLSEKRLKEMAESLKDIAQLPSPVNRILKGWQTKSGLNIQKITTPIGVILIIYEARPNVTSDCIGLLFKSSNVAILRGGRDAFFSNRAIYETLKNVVLNFGLNFVPFFLVEKTERKVVDYLLKENDYIDLVIPRGGEDLIRKVVNSSSIPVIKHYKGNCHIFVDKDADIEKAVKISVNAKCQRPSVCNAVETILVHKAVAKKFLPRLMKEFNKYRVKVYADEQTLEIIPAARKAKEDDWYREYLSYTVAIKVVKNIEEAVEHINFYGSHHTDSIITENINSARKFVTEVDSACCFVNISTRFSDGYQFGLGAEIGISTDKLHARGPMGLEELTTYKYIVYGQGQIRS